ncbi:MAG TPA: zincin-like metallopeptidase domain-containing protein [Bryobacteraceae bacterium]|nr:zincin-like metallopeptidase domain-containing protein [Bryobacteraceae bacterium]
MSTEQNISVRNADIYQRVTDAIVAAIEQGAGKYQMPWIVRQDKGFSPISISTVKPYRGVNTVVLWAQSQSKGYTSALWGTYQQWQELGGYVRKGERGSPVVYWGTFEAESKEPDTDESGNSRTRLFCKGYTVFNLEQVDGVKLPKRFEPKLSANQRIARAESFFDNIGIPIRDGGNQAFYRPSTDAVHMPDFTQFPDATQYYSVLAHEATHWTSHESRCDRELGKRFGDAAYAIEELIAELGSAYTMAKLELELTPRANHAAYIDSWLKVLKSDKRAIFTAGSKAQQAADYLVKRAGEIAHIDGVAA